MAAGRNPMRYFIFSLVISIACIASAEAQTAPPAPNRAAKPAPSSAAIQAATAKRAIAIVSKSSAPTYDEGTYQRISAAMLGYASIDVRGGWPTLPATARLAPGSTGPDVVTLRKRL